MGGKTTVETKSNGTQTVAPPSWTMPGISDAASKVTAALNNLPGNQYTGDFVATPDYSQAVSNYGKAATQASGLSDWTQQQVQGYNPVTANFSTDLSGTQVGGDQLKGALDAALAPLTKNLQETVLPGLKSSALDSGAYSNDRAIATLPQQALNDYTTNASNTLGQIGYQNASDNANRALAGYQADTTRGLGVGQLGADQQEKFQASLPDLIDTILRASTGAGDIATQSANLTAQQQQAAINDAKAKNDYSWQYPFQGLDIASSLLSQLSGNYGTTTSQGTNTQTTQTGGLGSILQGVLGAASSIGSLPVGGGGGTLIGSLFSGNHAHAG